MREGVTVNVDEGFLPRFSHDFKARYGAESVFVRGTSDLFTMAMARALAAKGLLQNVPTVKFFGSEEGMEAVGLVFRLDRELSMSLMNSAIGSELPDHFKSLLAKRFPRLEFKLWLAALETEDYVKCKTLFDSAQ